MTFTAVNGLIYNNYNVLNLKKKLKIVPSFRNIEFVFVRSPCQKIN